MTLVRPLMLIPKRWRKTDLDHLARILRNKGAARSGKSESAGGEPARSRSSACNNTRTHHLKCGVYALAAKSALDTKRLAGAVDADC